jgi:hypothetical protein
MFDVADSLREGFADADERLRTAQQTLARAQVRGGGRDADAAMANVAGGIIFTEALLAATRARFQEIQSAAKA